MGTLISEQIKITPLKRIMVEGGEVMHALKATDPGYQGFGEAYFSWIEPGVVKAWKRHKKMTMNLVVPVGHVRFVFSKDLNGPFEETKIGIESNYARLTVPPGVWFGFQGCASVPSLVLNMANIEHDPDEVERVALDIFKFNWGQE